MEQAVQRTAGLKLPFYRINGVLELTRKTKVDQGSSAQKCQAGEGQSQQGSMSNASGRGKDANVASDVTEGNVEDKRDGLEDPDDLGFQTSPALTAVVRNAWNAGLDT